MYSVRCLCKNRYALIVGLAFWLTMCLPVAAYAAKGVLDEFLKLGEKFDHLTTGFELTGEHAHIDCGDCHIGGVFEELTSRCDGCHDNVISIGKSPNHIETQAPCESCHTTIDFVATAEMDHSTTSNACVSCHNGVSSTAKPASHIRSTDVCEACHTTNAWTPTYYVDHDQVLGKCVDCHGLVGIAQTRKPANHISSSNNCEGCHLAPGDYWSPVAIVDHAFVLGACSSCHNGTIARGKGPDHIETNEECNVCHVTNDPNWTATAQN